MKTIIWTLAHLLSYLFVVTAKDCDMLTAAPLEASADIRALIELSDQQIAGSESEIDIWGSIGKKRSTLVCDDSTNELCLSVQNQPFCLNLVTYYYHDGNGTTGNLASGDYTLKDGRKGNIYNGPFPQPTASDTITDPTTGPTTAEATADATAPATDLATDTATASATASATAATTATTKTTANAGSIVLPRVGALLVLVAGYLAVGLIHH